MILSSVAEPEPHHFGGAGAGAMKRCDSGSDSSGIDRFSKMSLTQVFNSLYKKAMKISLNSLINKRTNLKIFLSFNFLLVFSL
jgi:hypothetical protein